MNEQEHKQTPVTMAREPANNLQSGKASPFRFIPNGARERNEESGHGEDEDEDQLEETGETNSTIWMLIYQKGSRDEDSAGRLCDGRKREDGMIEWCSG